MAEATIATAPLRFVQDLRQGPAWLQAWVALLVWFHFAMPLAMWRIPVAQATAIDFMLSGTMMMALYHRHGMVRLLGAAHVWWCFHVGWLLGMWPFEGAGGVFLIWCWGALATGIISLCIDAVDVVKWFRGDTDLVI